MIFILKNNNDNFSKKLSFIFVFILIALISCLSINIVVLHNKLDKIEQKSKAIEETQIQLAKANKVIDTLEVNYDKLYTSYQSLQINYNKLKTNYITLENNYNNLETDYNDIKNTIIGYNDNNHAILNKYNGVNYYKGHKETYYNLPMNRVVSIAQNKGYEGKYWVRKDGAKMYGLYVMVAADQSKYPYGTIVDTSLGEGIVLDTGFFIHSNSEQFDIATAW